VRLYSTVGGDVASSRRVTTPCASIARNRAASTFADTCEMSRRNSPKRRGPFSRNHTTFGAQAPRISSMQPSTGHSGGGRGVGLLRGCMAMRGPRRGVGSHSMLERRDVSGREWP
jgi:hypothetical protein